MQTTRLSSKGQVVLPGPTRARRGWSAGTEFSVEETPDGVLLKPLKVFAQTRVEDVFGMAHYNGPQRTLKDMEAAVAAEAQRRK